MNLTRRPRRLRTTAAMRSLMINGTTSTGTHHGNLTQIGIYLLGIRIQYVCTVTVDTQRLIYNH